MKQDLFSKTAEKIVNAQIKKPYYFLGVILIITLLFGLGIPNLINNVEPSLEKVLPQDIEEVKTMNNMRGQFGADMMYLVVKTTGPVEDVRNPQVLNYIDSLSQKIVTRENILEVRTLVDIVKSQNNNNVPNSLNTIKVSIKQNPLTPTFVNDQYSLTVMKVRTDTGSSASLIKQTVDEIKEDIASLENSNPGVKIDITGFNAIDKATFEIIISDFMKITMISMAFVMIIVLLTFRKFGKALLPMSVVMMALIWTMGIAGHLNFTITVVTMVAAAMIMGLGIDFGIHVVHTYYEQRKKLGKKNSLKETMKELLRAMTGASLTTTAGFLALLFGVLPAMKILGIILGIGIISTLLGAIFLLPVLTYLYDK
jgi:predicted RND superfamily exporter protein